MRSLERVNIRTNVRTYVLTYIRTGLTLYPLHNLVVRGDKKLLSSKISQTYVHSIDIQGENVKILIFKFCYLINSDFTQILAVIAKK